LNNDWSSALGEIVTATSVARVVIHPAISRTAIAIPRKRPGTLGVVVWFMTENYGKNRSITVPKVVLERDTL
jgi:hypothetical protein